MIISFRMGNKTNTSNMMDLSNDIYTLKLLKTGPSPYSYPYFIYTHAPFIPANNLTEERSHHKFVVLRRNFFEKGLDKSIQSDN